MGRIIAQHAETPIISSLWATCSILTMADGSSLGSLSTVFPSSLRLCERHETDIPRTHVDSQSC